MTKTFLLEDLDCANCAAKMEAQIAKIEGVLSVRVSFLTQKLKLEAAEADFGEIMKKVEACIRKVEPDCRVLR